VSSLAVVLCSLHSYKSALHNITPFPDYVAFPVCKERYINWWTVACQLHRYDMCNFPRNINILKQEDTLTWIGSPILKPSCYLRSYNKDDVIKRQTYRIRANRTALQTISTALYIYICIYIYIYLSFGHGIVQNSPTLTSTQDLFQPNSWQTPVAAITVYSDPEDGRKGRPKHVEHTCSF